MNDKEKITQFIEAKGISKNKFYKETGLSNGFLASGSSLGTDKLKIIIDTYPDFNLNWFFTGQGPMLKGVQSDPGDNETRLLTDQEIRKDMLNVFVSEAKIEKGMKEEQIASGLSLSAEEFQEYLFGKRPLYDDIWKQIVEFFRPLDELVSEIEATPESLFTKVKMLEQSVSDLRREIESLHGHISTLKDYTHTLKDFNQELQKKAPA